MIDRPSNGIDRPGNGTKKIIPFAPTPKDEAPVDSDPVERSGQAIVALLREAATVAKETCERALVAADQLSVKLRAAEAQIKELQADVQHYQIRATQAEKWLLRVHHEIEDRFFGPDVAPHSPQTGRSTV
jgi:xanthine dehydrogenase molybdopterin-binding subunit B